MRRILTTDRIVLGIAVRTPCTDQMYYPTQEPSGTDPRNSCQNQPYNTYEYSAVVNLTNTRNQETQNSGNQRFTHCSNLPPQVNNEIRTDLLQKSLAENFRGASTRPVPRSLFQVRGSTRRFQLETRNLELELCFQPPNISWTARWMRKKNATPAKTESETSGRLPP